LAPPGPLRALTSNKSPPNKNPKARVHTICPVAAQNLQTRLRPHRRIAPSGSGGGPKHSAGIFFFDEPDSSSGCSVWSWANSSEWQAPLLFFAPSAAVFFVFFFCPAIPQCKTGYRPEPTITPHIFAPSRPIAPATGGSLPLLSRSPGVVCIRAHRVLKKKPRLMRF